MAKPSKEDKRIEQVSVDTLIPYARNARTHSDAQVAQIAASIKEFGFNAPVLIDGKNGIIAGHGRVLAARKLDMTAVPCVRLEHMSETQKRAYILADNKLALNAGWDDEMLRVELDALTSDGVDLSLAGFDDNELGALLAPEPSDVDAEPQIDKADELAKKWGVETGQLWALGEHRLLCGDSTKAENVARVMAGESANMMFTDPPYNVSYQSNESAESLKKRNRRTDGKIVENDSMTDEEFDAFLVSFLGAAPLVDGGIFYICAPPGPTETQFRNAIAKSQGYVLKQCIVWVKDQFVFGRQDYHWRHESILYGWRPGAAHLFLGGRDKNTVWEISRPKQSEEHPTMKPVEIPATGISHGCKIGGVVYEPFSGSGTTIIACEQLNRRCRAIEISPGYVAVALQRWADATGKTPTLCK